MASVSQKRLSNSSSKISSKQVTPVQNRSGNNLASRCKNFMQDLVAKKSPKSLHVSLHFSSCNGESSKIISPYRQKIVNSKDLTASLKVSTNTSTSQTKIKVYTSISNSFFSQIPFFFYVCLYVLRNACVWIKSAAFGSTLSIEDTNNNYLANFRHLLMEY